MIRNIDRSTGQNEGVDDIGVSFNGCEYQSSVAIPIQRIDRNTTQNECVDNVDVS